MATVDDRYQSIITRADADCGKVASADTERKGEPSITIGKGGVGLAVFVSNNCSVTYDASGQRYFHTDECRPEQVRLADEEMARLRR